jgi:hypothetical protein
MNPCTFCGLLQSAGIVSAFAGALIAAVDGRGVEVSEIRGGTIDLNKACGSFIAPWPGHTCVCEAAQPPICYFTCDAAGNPGDMVTDYFCTVTDPAHNCSHPSLPCGEKLDCDPLACNDPSRTGACASASHACSKLYGCTTIDK